MPQSPATNIRETLNQRLGKTEFWQQSTDGFIVHRRNRESVTLSHEELSAFDPRLPSYLISVSRSQEHRGFGVMGVYGSDIEDTINHWSGLYQTIKNNKGSTYVVTGIEQLIDADDAVRLVGWFNRVTSYKLKVQEQSMVVERVSTTMQSVLTLEKKWLAEVHPGWQQRWDTIQALGLSSAESVGHLFPTKEPTQQPAVTLPNDLSY